MVTMTDPTNGVVTNDYDPQGRVVAQWDPAQSARGSSGQATTFDYSMPGEATITDPDGNVERQVYDRGYLVSITKGVGSSAQGEWTFDYDPLTGGETSV